MAIKAASLLITRVGGVALAFAYVLWTARVMTPTEVGQIAMLATSLVLGSLLVNLNYDSGGGRFLVRYIEAGQQALVNGYIRTGRRVQMVMGPLVMAGHFLLFHNLQPDIPVLAVGCTSLAIPILANLISHGRMVGQLGMRLRSQSANLFLRPLYQFLMVVGLTVFLGGLSLERIGGVLLVSTVLAWISQRLLLAGARVIPRLQGPTDYGPARDWISTGIVLIPRMAMEQYLPDLIVFASSAALSHQAIGLLNICMRLVNLIRFGVVSIDLSIAPQLVKADVRGEAARRDGILRRSAHMRFWPTLAGCAVLAALAPWILSLFGPIYAVGADVVRIALITPLTLAFFGPSHLLLTARGHARLIGLANAIAVSGMFVLVPIIAVPYGLLGSMTVAVALILVLQASLNGILLRREKLDASIVGALFRFRRQAVVAQGNG